MGQREEMLEGEEARRGEQVGEELVERRGEEASSRRVEQERDTNTWSNSKNLRYR